MADGRSERPIERCDECDIGVASGTRDGRACPWEQRELPRGAIVYRAGAPAEGLWFVKAGTVALSDGGASPRVRAVRWPGSIIGLEALIEQAYVDTATAVSPVKLCAIDRRCADAWLGAADRPARLVLEVALRAQGSDPLATAANGTAVRRVARWLCDGAPLAGARGVTQGRIAELLGMRPETLSRALRALRDHGAIRVHRGLVTIVSGDRLRAIADRDLR